MKRVFVFTLVICLTTILMAQKIPSESPKAKLVQRIGISDVSITYSRPGVKGRKIFGGLLPYGKIWRTGADFPTLIRFTDTTYFGIKKDMLPPSKYAFYTIPAKDKWIIIFSKDTLLWGAFGYNSKNDAIRFEVPVDTLAHFTETFTIDFLDVEDCKANIVLQWENTKVSFPISVNIDNKVIQYVKEKIQSSEKPDYGGICRYGSKYLLKRQIEPDLALEWINLSINNNEDWENLWTKAQILAWRGDYYAALDLGKKALANGTNEENYAYFPYEHIYKYEIEKWKSMLKK